LKLYEIGKFNGDVILSNNTWRKAGRKTPPTKASAMFSFFAMEEIEREMKEVRKMNGANNKAKSECKQSLTFTSLESPTSKDLVFH
jgi:hypothetical protein